MTTPAAAGGENPLAAPEAWDAVAEGYAAELQPLFGRYAEDALRLAAPAADARVLDVAAGPGTLALLAAPRVAHVTALDFSPDMVRLVRDAAAARGIANLDARVGNGQALPFADASYDAAFSMFGLMFFPDRAAGFRELRRVLRPGGQAVVSSWAPVQQVPLLAAVFAALRSLSGAPAAPAARAPLSDPDDFRREMEAAGFGEVTIHEVAHESSARSVEEFWAAQERSSAPMAVARRRLGDERWADAAAATMERLRREFGSGPLVMRWPAYLGAGRCVSGGPARRAPPPA